MPNFSDQFFKRLLNGYDMNIMQQSECLAVNQYMSQDLTKGTFWQLKSKVRNSQRKKDLAVVNNYRKFEEIIFTNNKDMSV